MTKAERQRRAEEAARLQAQLSPEAFRTMFPGSAVVPSGEHVPVHEGPFKNKPFNVDGVPRKHGRGVLRESSRVKG